MKRIIVRSAITTVFTLFGGLVLGLLVGSLAFALIPGSRVNDVQLGHAAIAAVPAVAGFLLGGAAWGMQMGHIAGGEHRRRMAWAGILGFGPITALLALGLGLAEPVLVEQLGGMGQPIHRIFTLLFVPSAFLIGGISAWAIGLGLQDRRLARSLFWRVGLTSGTIFLLINLGMEAAGWVVGAPGAAARATMLIVLASGNIGAALAGGAVMGFLFATLDHRPRTNDKRFQDPTSLMTSVVGRSSSVGDPRSVVGRQIASNAAPQVAGRWLQAARLGWVILGATALVILLASLPGYVGKLGGELSHSARTFTADAQFFAAASGLTSLASALLSLGLSWVLFRRKFAEPAAMALSFFLLFYGIVMAGPLERAAMIWLGPSDFGVYLQALMGATPMVALLLVFPNGRFVPSWTRWVLLMTVPWSLYVLLLPPLTGAFFEAHPFQAFILVSWYLVLFLLSIYAQIYRYRHHSTMVEKQQMKWVVFGFGLWFLVILLTSGPYFYLTTLPSGAPTPWWAPVSELVWFMSLNIIPVSFTIAIMRYRLWNIDLVINRALIYGGLTGSLVAIYFVSVVLLQRFLPAESQLSTVFSTLAIAGLFRPLHKRIQRDIDRLFYRRKYNAAQTLAAFNATAREEVDLSRLSESLLAIVEETMQPEGTTLWIRPKDHY